MCRNQMQGSADILELHGTKVHCGWAMKQTRSIPLAGDLSLDDCHSERQRGELHRVLPYSHVLKTNHLLLWFAIIYKSHHWME